MRITLIAGTEPGAAPAIADEIRRQVLSRGAIAAAYTAPATGETASQLAKELSIADAVALEALDAGNEHDTLALLRRLQATAWTALERFREEHGAEDEILLIAPALTVRAVVCRALSIPAEDSERFRLDPGSLSTLEFRIQQNRTILVSLNETCHMAGR